jgi:DNA-binding GntR family transcriptional regulator
MYSLATIVIGGGMGLGSVWMRHQISLTANTNRILETQIAEVRRHSEEIRTAVAEEQDITVLKRRNEEWHLGLVPQSQEQVQAVLVNPMARLAAKRNRDIFPAGVESVSFRVAWQH